MCWGNVALFNKKHLWDGTPDCGAVWPGREITRSAAKLRVESLEYEKGGGQVLMGAWAESPDNWGKVGFVQRHCGGRSKQPWLLTWCEKRKHAKSYISERGKAWQHGKGETCQSGKVNFGSKYSQGQQICIAFLMCSRHWGWNGE